MSTPVPDQAEALKFLATLAQANLTPTPMTVDGLECFALPGKALPESAEGYLATPRRTRAVVSFYDLPSFLTYYVRHRDTGSMLTGRFNEKGGHISAILDYHEPADGPEVNGARWCQHHAKFVAEPTPEWSRWLQGHGVSLTQLAFAEFLEDNSADIIVPEHDPKAPNAAMMISVATTLEAKTDVAFNSSVRLDSGAMRLNYSEVVAAGAQGESGVIAIPDRFYISVAPFISADRYLVAVRLRFRLDRGKVTFIYLLDRPHKVVDAVARDFLAKVKEVTGSDVLLGSVESVNAGVNAK